MHPSCSILGRSSTGHISAMQRCVIGARGLACGPSMVEAGPRTTQLVLPIEAMPGLRFCSMTRVDICCASSPRFCTRQQARPRTQVHAHTARMHMSHAHTHVHARTSMHARPCTHVHLRTSMHAGPCMQVHARRSMHARPCMHIHACASMYPRPYARIRANTPFFFLHDVSLRVTDIKH